ncbi:MAG: hypothetical protein K8S54_21595 [Spirochaetia bacterium]|nr:hypothetical protein [Spirochaetia bacterium]
MRLFVLTPLLLLTCTTYSTRDRFNDAADIAGFSLDTSIGAQASFSGATVGVYAGGAMFGIHNGGTDAHPFDMTLLGGLGCNTLLHIEDFDPEFDNEYALFRNKTHCADRAARMQAYDYGRLRIRAGVLLGLSFELNLFELVDFLTGFGGVDLFDDDWNEYYGRLRTDR